MSSHDDIVGQLTREIASRAHLEPHEVDPDAHFLRDLGMSSLDLLSVLAFAEKTFGIRFPDERLSELTTLNQVENAVRTFHGQEANQG